MSPPQGRPGQRAVGVENRDAQRAVVARAAAALGQKLGNLGVLSSEAPDGLTSEARVLVEGIERDAVDQT